MMMNSYGQWVPRPPPPPSPPPPPCYLATLDASSSLLPDVTFNVTYDNLYDGERPLDGHFHITSEDNYYVGILPSNQQRVWTKSESNLLCFFRDSANLVYFNAKRDDVDMQSSTLTQAILASGNIAPFSENDVIRIKVNTFGKTMQWCRHCSENSNVFTSVTNVSYLQNATDLFITANPTGDYRELFHVNYVGDPRNGIITLKTLDGKNVGILAADAHCSACPWSSSTPLRIGTTSSTAFQLKRYAVDYTTLRGTYDPNIVGSEIGWHLIPQAPAIGGLYLLCNPSFAVDFPVAIGSDTSVGCMIPYSRSQFNIQFDVIGADAAAKALTNMPE